jgi:hypothetical protein
LPAANQAAPLVTVTARRSGVVFLGPGREAVDSVASPVVDGRTLTPVPTVYYAPEQALHHSGNGNDNNNNNNNGGSHMGW